MKEIKVTDFRIGNYIYDRLSVLHYLKIEAITNNGLTFKKNSSYVTSPHFETALITPEILVALGFEDWGKIDYEFEYKRWVLHNVIDDTSNFEVRQYDDGGWEYSIDINEPMQLPNAEYLHTLQNMFFLHAGYDLQLDFTKLKSKK